MNTHPDNPDEGKKNGGYGYCIEEIIRYYDKTEPNEDAIFSNVLADMSDGILDGLWLHPNEKADFESFYDKWLYQPKYDPEDEDYDELWKEPLYINNLIDLIEHIETNEDYTIDLICTINILSEPADKVLEMIDYLRSPILNGRYAVHVYGVEMGNECYFPYYGRGMGFGCYYHEEDGETYEFSAFDHYWAYINGTDDYNLHFGLSELDLVPEDLDFDLSDVLDASMIGNHNYIYSLKSNSAYDDIKIGIPVEEPQNDGAYLTDGDDELLERIAGTSCVKTWNASLSEHYDEKLDGRYLIDAVIPHQYYVSENGSTPENNINWGEIPIGNYYATLPSGATEFVPICLDQNNTIPIYDDFTGGTYQYVTNDERLDCAFQGIINPELPGNFVTFTKTRHRQAMLDLAEELGLDGTSADPKECWISEWNIKNNSPVLDDEDAEALNKNLRKEVYMNTFVHAYLMQEQMMTNYKLNYSANFEPDFLTITSVNNFSGGSNSTLIRLSSTQDQTALNLVETCTTVTQVQLPRTLYHSFTLGSPIHINNLRYLKSVKTLYNTNINQAPTVFIEQAHGTATERDIYFYYTNIKNHPQTYIIKPHLLYDGSFEGILGQVNCIEAKQLYSKSGAKTLYEINNAYDLCADDGYSDYFEITGPRLPFFDNSGCPIDAPLGSTCVTVPGYSLGYFKITYNPSLREGEFQSQFEIYPNPAVENCYLVNKNEANGLSQTLAIYIINMYGSHIAKQFVKEGERIDLSLLPAGLYSLAIFDGDNLIETKKIVKTQ